MKQELLIYSGSLLTLLATLGMAAGRVGKASRRGRPRVFPSAQQKWNPR